MLQDSVTAIEATASHDATLRQLQVTSNEGNFCLVCV